MEDLLVRLAPATSSRCTAVWHPIDLTNAICKLFVIANILEGRTLNFEVMASQAELVGQEITEGTAHLSQLLNFLNEATLDLRLAI